MKNRQSFHCRSVRRGAAPGCGARPAVLACAILLALSFWAGAPLLAEVQHDGDQKPFDHQPPYVGAGYAGAPLVPGRLDSVLDMFGSNVALLSWMPLGDFPGGSANANDCFGYVSPSGREYAILGLERGTGFVDITNPSQPQLVSVVPDATSLWSDMSIYDRYCYNVNEAGNGIQVIDLHNIDSGQVQAVYEAHDQGINRAHNIKVNAASRTLYSCGGNLNGGGLSAWDIGTDPSRPRYVGTWNAMYVHDVFPVTYTSGPYAGREIAFCACGENGLRILDVTNKANMHPIGTLVYPTVAYCHHSWLDANRRYLYVNDELDELNGTVATTTTYLIDVQSLENPVLVRGFTNGLPAIDHNPLGRGNYLFEANYRSGLRVYDISNPSLAHEVGYFDSYPADDEAHFNGAWGTYPWLPSGVILLSDMERGLFVLRLDLPASAEETPPAAAVLLSQNYPNPLQDHTRLAFHLNRSENVRLRIVDPAGRAVETLVDGVLPAGHHVRVWHAEDGNLASGVYFAILRAGSSEETRRMVLIH